MSIISNLLGHILRIIFKFVNNYGWSIIVFTLFVTGENKDDPNTKEAKNENNEDIKKDVNKDKEQDIIQQEEVNEKKEEEDKKKKEEKKQKEQEE